MNGPAGVLNKLEAVLARVETDIHELEIIEADLLEDTIWYQSCRTDRRNLLRKTATAALHRPRRQRGPHLRRLEVRDEPTALLAQHTAYTPFRVLVENRDSDGALVKFAMMIFATPTTWDLCYGSLAHETPPAFEVDSGGGSGELKKVVSDRVEETRVRGVEPRLVAMTECDGEWVGDVKAQAQAIVDECTAKGVPCQLLSKRTIENYVPDVVWRAWIADRQRATMRPAVEALLRLTATQRDHVRFAIPRKAPWNRSEPNVALLFAGVSAIDQQLLTDAGLKVAASHAITFALEDQTLALAPADIYLRDPRGELEALVRSIEDGL
jgi:hypothetical protein